MGLFNCLTQPLVYLFGCLSADQTRHSETVDGRTAGGSPVGMHRASVTGGSSTVHIVAPPQTPPAADETTSLTDNEVQATSSTQTQAGPPSVPQISVRRPTQPPEVEDPAPPTPNALSPSRPSHRNPDSFSSRRTSDDDVHPLPPSRSSSKSSTAADSLKKLLRDARIESPRSSHCFFVPQSAQDSLLTVATVAKDIRDRNTDIGPVAAQHHAQQACHGATQLFAILAYIKKGGEIISLLKENISDEDLPFRRPENNEEPFALQRKSGLPIDTFTNWNDNDLEKFDRVQWWMIARVFEDKAHYDLLDNEVLPFLPLKTNHEMQKPIPGGYSEVYPVRVHPAHHKFWPPCASKDAEPLVAIKKLYSSDEKEFNKEVTILQALGSKRNKHPHLIKLLATYQQKQKYHLMFPYADANLRRYWDDRPEPTFDRTTVLWSLAQMTGIASALNSIHNFSVTIPLSAGEARVQKKRRLMVDKSEELFGRHGDIKPENILWFKKCDDTKDENGILQIADFGLGRFHGRDSRSKVKPETVLASPTYEPPECKLQKPVSRAYDIWSLGCLYLEFVTWLLKGSAEIECFSNFRGRLATNEINDDNFFTIESDPTKGTDAVVREAVVTWVRRLHENPKCSAVIHDLLELIMNDILVISSSDRIKSEFLYLSLKKMLIRARHDTQYLLDPPPEPHLDRSSRSQSAPIAPKSPSIYPHINGAPAAPREDDSQVEAQTGSSRDLVGRTAGTPGLGDKHGSTWPPTKDG